MQRHAKLVLDVIDNPDAPSGVVESFYDDDVGAELFRLRYADGHIVTCTVAELLFC